MISTARFARLIGAAAVVIAALAGGCAVPADAQSGDDLPPTGAFLRDTRARFTTFDAPGAELETVATGINNRGHVVGGYVEDDNGGRAHGFLWRHGRFNTFDVPGASDANTSAFLTYPGSGALDINDRGQIVGGYSDPNGAARGFLRDSSGRFTTIDVPDAAETLAFGLNNKGEVVGLYLGTDGRPHSFLRDARGQFSTVDAPDAFSTAIFDIDDEGRMVGAFFESQTTSRGLLRDAQGRVTTFDAPDAAGVTAATGINAGGQIVGQYNDAQGATHGFLRGRRGTVSTIDPPGASGFSVAFHLNDRGQIVGAFQRPAAPAT